MNERKIKWMSLHNLMYAVDNNVDGHYVAKIMPLVNRLALYLGERGDWRYVGDAASMQDGKHIIENMLRLRMDTPLNGHAQE